MEGIGGGEERASMRSFVLEEKGREKCPVEDFHLVEEALGHLKEDSYSFLCLFQDDEQYIRCDTSQVEDPCVTVRKSSRGDRWAQYYHFTRDWADIQALFSAYWQGTLDPSGWEEQVEEQLTARLSDLTQPAQGAFPWADTLHKAFAAGQLMKIAELLSQGDPDVLEKLNASLADPTLLRRAEEAPALGPLRNEMTPKERVILDYYTEWEDMPGDPITARFINGTRRAKWLPKGTALGVKDLLWTCLQWDVMVGLLKEREMIACLPVLDRYDEGRLSQFQDMMAQLLAEQGLEIDYHNKYFKQMRTVSGWSATAQGVLADHGWSLVMLGERRLKEYLYALIPIQEERGLWTRSLAIGMRACTLCQYTCLSAGSMLWTIDGEERTKLWRQTGMIREF